MAEIQKAQTEDIPELTEMWHEFMEYHRDLREWAYTLAEGATEKIHKRFEAYIQEEDKLVLNVLDEEDPVGFAVARIEAASDVFDTGPRARITDFFLRPEARGKNLGRRLVRNVSDWARENEAEHLFMSIDANNEVGRQFWEALDFECTKETYLTEL